MKHIIIFSISIVMSFDLCANWKIGTLKNLSDLPVLSASYTKPKGKKGAMIIEHLTDKIKNAVNKKSIVLDYTVNETSKGCSRIDLSAGYYLSLDGHHSHSIMWARAKTQANKKYIGKEVLDVHKHQYCARVFLEKDSYENPLNYSALGYNNEGELFDIILSGAAGNYVVTLQKI